MQERMSANWLHVISHWMVPVGCRGTACSTMGLSWTAGNHCSSLEHLLPSVCANLGACRAVSLTFLTSLSLSAAVVQQFFPFFSLLSQRHTQCCSWLSSAQQCVTSGAAEGGSDLTWGSCLALLTDTTPATSRCQNLSKETQYRSQSCKVGMKVYDYIALGFVVLCDK